MVHHVSLFKGKLRRKRISGFVDIVKKKKKKKKKKEEEEEEEEEDEEDIDQSSKAV